MCSPEGQEIVKYLLDIGCCLNCSVRYLCDKKLEFSELDDFLDKLDFVHESGDGGEEKIKRIKSNPCVVCLGLLQVQLLEDILQSKDLESAKLYDNPMFSVSISMPPSIIVREHSMRIHLVEKFPNFFTDDNIEIPINRVWKMFVKNPMAKSLEKIFQSSDVGDFFVNITTEYADDVEELNTLKDMKPDEFKIRLTQHRKYHGELFSRKGVLSILARISEKLFKIHAPCPPLAPTHFLKCKVIECKHNPAYIAGRYCKFSRELSQTPWVVDGVKLMETSVQEIMFESITKLFNIKQKNMKFSSSGREDCDVRCLGKGRPFYIEIADPRRIQYSFEEFRALEASINQSDMIQVRDLQMVKRADTEFVKQGEEKKTKTYIALCVCKQAVTEEMLAKINNYGELTVQQKTPIRVLHRRPLSVRPKSIRYMKATMTGNSNCFELEVCTQAGTYVKEFVHGDFGRTRPNVNEIIGCAVDIAALDVVAVDLDWPKEVVFEND